MNYKERINCRQHASKHILLVLSFLGLSLLLGCGTLADRVTPVGEGDIPVGRTIGNRGPVSMTIESSDGSITNATSDEAGLIYIPRQQLGPATVRLSPSNPEEAQVEFPIDFGISQNFVIVAESRPAIQQGQVERIDIKLPGSNGQLKVGQTVPVVIKVFGSVPGNIKPTVWIDGGVAEVGPGIILKATASGSGVIRAELYGVVSWLHFSVQ